MAIKLATTNIVSFILCATTCTKLGYAVDMNWTAIEPLSPLLPRPATFMASYYDTNAKIIHLLGGKQHPLQWIKYDITTNTFMDNGNQSLEQGTPTQFLWNLQYYTQMAGFIYWMDEYKLYRTDASRFGRANSAILVGQSWDGYDACLTSSDVYIFVISDGLTIFDVDTLRWTEGATLNVNDRTGHACTYNHIMSEIYVIGGRYHISNERIFFEVGNSTETWEYIDDLIFGVTNMQAFYNHYDDSVVVIGGDWIHDYGNVDRKEIQVINCQTGTVSVDAYLSYPVSQYTAVWADDILYIFGGQIDGSITDKWQIVEGRPDITDDPTPAPTSSPSQPTAAPSKRPTFAPSSHPTKNPTASRIIAYEPSSGEGEASDITKSGGLTGNSDGNTVSVQNTDSSVFVVIVIALILICLAVVFIGYMIWRLRNQMESMMHMQSSMLSQYLEMVRVGRKNSMDVDVVYEDDDAMDNGPGYDEHDQSVEDQENLEKEEKKEDIAIGQPTTSMMQHVSDADSMYLEVEEESLNGAITKGTPGVDEN